MSSFVAVLVCRLSVIYRQSIRPAGGPTGAYPGWKCHAKVVERGGLLFSARPRALLLSDQKPPKPPKPTGVTVEGWKMGGLVCITAHGSSFVRRLHLQYRVLASCELMRLDAIRHADIRGPKGAIKVQPFRIDFRLMHSSWSRVWLFLFPLLKSVRFIGVSGLVRYWGWGEVKIVNNRFRWLTQAGVLNFPQPTDEFGTVTFPAGEAR